MAYIKIRIRGDTAENWKKSNPILEEREIAVEVAQQSASPWKLKIGDGKTPWNDLGYSFDYDLVNQTYINTYNTYLNTKNLYDSFSSTWKQTSQSFADSLKNIQEAEITISASEAHVVQIRKEIDELVNNSLIQATQQILKEIQSYLDEINSAKEGLVLNIAAGNATSFDVQNIDGGNATTVDPYKLDAGNALSILN